MFKIVRKNILGPEIVQMEIEAKNIAPVAKPGQFVILIVHEKGERIPLTIADRDNDLITIVFQVVGKTTTLLAKLAEGDFLCNVVGPLGNPTDIETFGRVICVGGGIGIAPVYPIARALKKKGNEVISIIGYRSKDYVFWEEKIRSASHRVIVTTNDGSYGFKGFVTDALKEMLNEHIDRVFTIGPTIMMREVSKLTKERNIKTVASLNSLMVCGMGMCGTCRVRVGGETKFTCFDGPDFDGHLVDFDELIKRLDTYKEEERISLETLRKEIQI